MFGQPIGSVGWEEGRTGGKGACINGAGKWLNRTRQNENHISNKVLLLFVLTPRKSDVGGKRWWDTTLCLPDILADNTYVSALGILF